LTTKTHQAQDAASTYANSQVVDFGEVRFWYVSLHDYVLRQADIEDELEVKQSDSGHLHAIEFFPISKNFGAIPQSHIQARTPCGQRDRRFIFLRADTDDQTD
jgi:hypothetical protein